jgi:hypothetical protein
MRVAVEHDEVGVRDERRELLARTRLDPARRDRLTPLLGALYRTAFASEPISAEEYRGWVRALREVSDAPAA